MTPGRTLQGQSWSVERRTLEHYGAPDLEVSPDKISLWCWAFFYCGNFLRLWNEALEIKMALLTSGAFQKGHNVVLVGKYADESGLTQAIRALIGQDGKLIRHEIGQRVLESTKYIEGEPGRWPKWDFDYFSTLSPESIDRVVFFGSTSHVSNWLECVQQIKRVLRPGGKVVIGDVHWGGRELLSAAYLDTHLEGIISKLLSGMKLDENDLPDLGPKRLEEIFKPYLSWSHGFSWRGLYLFHGQKEITGDNIYTGVPFISGSIQEFLIEKPYDTNPWSFLADVEKNILGPDITNVDYQKYWGRIINWGGGFGQNERYASIMKPMWDNLQAKPGNKVLVIGEFLEWLFLPELRKRIGERGEVAINDINAVHRATFEKLWKFGPDTFIPERHQWDYPFADKYPDNYFDLVWLPQGVHHARDWKSIAPRLARVLKVGGQVMMIENRTGAPEFFLGLSMHGLLRCIAEKIWWWAWHVTLEELPDYSTTQLAQAFGDALTGVYRLEWRGWLLFWGYKK